MNNEPRETVLRHTLETVTEYVVMAFVALMTVVSTLRLLGIV